ncbi:MAG TPA: hypothetical protein VIA18_02755 [Polyangia bacterium]|nr:hypothetical protein [Polyangia bacterium]
MALCALFAGTIGCSSSKGHDGVGGGGAGGGGAPAGGGGSPAGGGGSGGGGGTTAPTDGGAPNDDGGTTNPPDAGPPAKQSLVWVWQDFSNTLTTVAQHSPSFTQVSPALYQLNYAYTSGAAQLLSTSFDGLTPTQIAQKIHAAGLQCIPLIYAGAGNSGVDTGIQNVITDTPAGAQQSFITSMIADAATYGWDGYNLDWEVQNLDHSYSDQLNSFLAKFRDALHAKGLTVSLDLGGWYVQQCTDSGGNGFVDLKTLAASVDWAILEDYSGALGSPNSGGCPSGFQDQIDCSSTFTGGLNVMCDLPPANVSIGLISPVGGNGGTNIFAGAALDAVNAYGFRAVAVWPDDSVFLNANDISPAGATWYSLLAGYLEQQ